MNQFFVWVPVGLYLAGWLVDFLRYWRAEAGAAHWGWGLMAIGWGAHTIFLASGLFEQVSTLPNLLSGAAWLAIILYYFILGKFEGPVFGFIFPPFAVAALLLAALLSAQPLPSIEHLAASLALIQAVLITHIVTVLSGHLLFALACLFGIVYLYQEHQLKTKRSLMDSRLPSLGALEHLNFKAIILGFLFLSVGILLGVVLSGLMSAPMRMLTWRQAIPLFTWLVYAAFLLEHSVQGRRGRFGAIWSIAGFLIVTTSLIFELLLLFRRA
ncbi:MAG: cytochrome c biogenesis protein CcsA [SAR324 cluster bacterium]|nr:cytochrome c biogenesis protein CcsA [SAR324 cluster bacterium]MCZ6628024.1 cytochrome c biogenesis protein CcsA [SAR324 cluster bacterium]